MIWLSHICFSALFAVQTMAATVSGSVQLADSRDPKVRRQADYSGVAVWLEPVGAPAAAAQPRVVKVLQTHKEFVPHVTAIPVGGTVDFPNFDPIFHNAFSNFSGQPFDVGLYAPGTSQRVSFRRPGIVRVFCNIHPTMSAVIVVVRTPYVAVSDKKGAFSLDGVPPGEYMLRVFHERAAETALGALERKLTVTEAPLTLPAMVISESGWVQISHKNKYGKDYPPVIEDRAAYPAPRK